METEPTKTTDESHSTGGTPPEEKYLYYFLICFGAFAGAGVSNHLFTIPGGMREEIVGIPVASVSISGTIALGVAMNVFLILAFRNPGDRDGGESSASNSSQHPATDQGGQEDASFADRIGQTGEFTLYAAGLFGMSCGSVTIWFMSTIPDEVRRQPLVGAPDGIVLGSLSLLGCLFFLYLAYRVDDEPSQNRS
jgi:hypothetical protein